MILRLDNICKDYDKEILKNVSIDIDGYSAVAIIGASGCGKSTLLRLLSAIELPESGSIQINSDIVDEDNLSVFQKKIGFVFQKHNLFPHLTLKKNITLILEKTRGYSKNEADNIATDILTKLRLDDQMDKLPRHVSGGQSQRASIARALSTNPDLLILDEPTASLDPILTHEVLDVIRNLRDMGKDFIFVTHEIEFVKKFADYFVFMDEGEIIEHGKIKNIENPQTDKLKRFLFKVSY